MGISETHAVAFFDTYLGRIERYSAPLGSISTSIVPHLILAVLPTAEHFRKIHKAATKSFTSQCPTRLVNTSIAPLLSQERNIQSCNVPDTGLVPIFSYIDLEGGIWATFCVGLFGRTSMIWDGCASELNKATAPLLNGHIRATFQAVDCCPSSIYWSTSSHFCAIVAVMEVERMADDMPKIEFCEFQEYEPQNNASWAKLHVRRSDTEVGMVAAYRLCGLRLGKVAMRWEWERRLGYVRIRIRRFPRCVKHLCPETLCIPY